MPSENETILSRLLSLQEHIHDILRRSSVGVSPSADCREAVASGVRARHGTWSDLRAVQVAFVLVRLSESGRQLPSLP